MTTTENEDDHGASSCKVDSIQAPDIRQNYEIPDFEIFKKCMSVKTCVVRNTSADSNDAKTADLIDLNKSIDSEKDEVKADSDDFDVSKLNQELERIEVRLRKEIAEQPLPKDWERYEDDQGPYYWHVPSGTIQREVPSGDNDEELQKRQSIIYFEEEDEEESDDNGREAAHKTNGDTLVLEHAFDNQAPANGFLAYALGSMPFDVSQLTPESSAKALQRCIVNLSTKNDGAVRVWGKTGGKRLRLRIERACVKLCDEATGHVLHLQALDGIRVWGVNANNDFAYVANETDRSSSPLATVHSSSLTNDDDGDDAISSLEEQLPPLRCHIFHCEQQFDLETNESLTAVKENTSAARLSEAEQIACLLKAEMLRYRREQSGNELGDDWTALDEHSSSAASTPSVELPANSIGRMSHGVSMPANLSSHHLPFTRSIDTPGPGSIRQTMIGNYLGATQVPCPAGVQMLNDAIDRVLEQRNAPIVCLLHITRSSITIENSNSAQTLFECRVRLLSFLGISQLDARVCGFVQQRTRQTFIAHVFECRPNAVHLCRAIETACKARFEACVRAQKAKCASESDEYMPTEVSTSIRTGLNRFAYTRPSSAQIKRTVRNVFAKFLQK